MNVALLTITSLSLVTSVSTLLVLGKMAKELKAAKTEVDAVKTKVNHNAQVVKAALGSMEF